MHYDHMEKAVFRERKNRFVAEVEHRGNVIGVHVPNTGRCRELFQPGASVYIQRAANPRRKYPYTLSIVEKNGMLVHIDSAGANRLVEEALISGRIAGLEDVAEVEREKTFGSSRFDFRFRKGSRICFMEVKGVTLEMNGVAKFPDAPTERGARHLEELISVTEQGLGAYVMFVIQMKGPHVFMPYVERDEKFACNLLRAKKAGVKILAYDAMVTAGDISLDAPVKICLPGEEMMI